MQKRDLRPAVSTFFLMLTMSLISTALAFFVEPVCADLGFGAVSTLMPVVVREIFGGRDYTAIWSVVLTCSSVTSFAATPAWGMVYDIFGSYLPALVVTPVLLAASVFALTAAFQKKA